MSRTRTVTIIRELEAFVVTGQEADLLGSLLMRKMADHLGYPVFVDGDGAHHSHGTIFDRKNSK